MRHEKQVEPDRQELDALANLFNQQRYDEVVYLSRLLVGRFPEHGYAWKVLGAVLRALGQADESLAAKRKAAALLPDDHDAHFNLAYGLHQQGCLDESVKSYFRALTINPNNADTYSNLGDLFKILELFPDAEAYCRQAIALRPDLANAHNNLGNALHAQDKFEQAQTSYRLALSLKPDWAEAHNNLAMTLQDQGYWHEAQASYRKALTLAPAFSAAHSNLIHVMSLDVQVDARQLYSENLAFAKQFEAPIRAGWQAHDNVKDSARCLHVGFVSGDLYIHAVATFLEPLLKILAKRQTLTLHAYCTHAREDAVNQRLRTYFPHWHAVASLSDVELANKIRADHIDILIDLSGHTAHNRLTTFAHKPAPVQATWLGYPGTTGLQAMDYHLRDQFWIPPGELDWQFTEKPAFLPAWAIYQPSEHAPPVNTLPALENGYITFGSFNRPNKLNASVIVLWSMLMRDTPSARMVLGAIPQEHQEALIESFAHEGIEQNRLIFHPRSNIRDYLALHHQVDMCLDSFPYGGGTTTLHAAWMGVPTLTLAGETPSSRLGATLMNQLNLDELIATSIEDFVNKGRYWAEHIAELVTIRRELRTRFESSALGQAEPFAASFEATLRAMWQRWCNDLPPATIEVEAPPENKNIAEPSKQVEPNLEELETLANLFEQQRHVEAEYLSRMLVGHYPEHGFAWKVLGSVLHSLGRLEESLAIKKKTAELRPNDHEAHFNLACGFHQQGRLDEAMQSYSHALSIQPNNAIAYSNLGNILIKLGFLPEAEAHCRQAIALKPDMANAHNLLGSALHAQGKFAQAQTSYRQALVLKPDWAEAYNNLAITLKDQGNWIEAKACYRKALEIAPDWAAAHSNLLYCLSHDVAVEPHQLFAEHLAFGEQFEAPLRAGWQAHNNSKDPARGLQVGFVSGDFYDHAVASFLESVFKFLARKQALSLHAYYTHTREDAVTQRLRTYFPHWHSVASLSEVELANKIRADHIDILIDLSGHTAHNRLLTFAHKPAPIQASWLGYLGTTGLQAMDYYLCDRFWIPPGELDWQFTEKPAFLPAAVTFQPNEQAPPVNSLPALLNGYVTFGSFNRTNKLNTSVIALWSMLLRDIPNARMVLGAIPPDHQDALTQSFAHEGIEQSRLIFYPRSNLNDYLALHHQVDFCLDTFPYGGGATTAHAAWMGVPTLSLAGESPPSRFGATEIHHLGLNGFIATSIDDFVIKGKYWAEHIEELAAIRVEMRTRFNASALGQPEPFATSFEAILRAMWQRWCNDLPAASIEVESNHQGLHLPQQLITTTSNGPIDKNTNRPLKPRMEIVSATKLSENDFWSTSALGLSLTGHLKKDARLGVNIAFENLRGLPEIFNDCINQAEDDSILVFIHDDVWIDEVNFSDAVIAGLEKFDVIGVAGNCRRVPNQPAWAFIDDQFTWDDKSNLSGRVAHGKNAFGQVSNFGAVPAQCELLDGVFLATKKSSLNKNNVRFDAQFDFHFYDMDFCRSARKAGLTLGTWQVNLTHQSGGAFGSLHWREKYHLYLTKWESASPTNDTTFPRECPTEREQTLYQAIIDALQLALEYKNSDQLELARHIYLEILKIQPKHADANHNLGLIEISLKGALAALPRLEIAVVEMPEHEQYWVSYIEALMQSRPADIVADALEFGQKYGLRKETAQSLATDFVIALEAKIERQHALQVSVMGVLQMTPEPSKMHQAQQINHRENAVPVFYIWAPAYTEYSSGSKALHLLCDRLNRLGYEAYVTTSMANASLITPQATTELINRHKQLGKLQIAIYPEVQIGNPLSVPNVVRYLLNKPNFFLKTSWFGSFHKDERVLHFDDTFAIPWLESQSLSVQTVDRTLFRTYSEEKAFRSGFLVYSHRVFPDLDKIPDWCRNFQLISMAEPRSPEALAKLYQQSAGLIVFERTSAATEAMLCGCPVIFCSSYGLEKSSVYYEGYNDYAIAWDFDRHAYQRAQKSIESFAQIYDAQSISDIEATAVTIDGIVSHFQSNEPDAIETTPAFALNRAAQYMQQGNIKEAIIGYKQLITDHSSNVEAYLRMGEALAMIGLLMPGLKTLIQGESHLAQLPKHESLDAVRAMYYSKLGEVCHAIGDPVMSNKYIELSRPYQAVNA